MAHSDPQPPAAAAATASAVVFATAVTCHSPIMLSEKQAIMFSVLNIYSMHISENVDEIFQAFITSLELIKVSQSLQDTIVFLLHLLIKVY